MLSLLISIHRNFQPSPLNPLAACYLGISRNWGSLFCIQKYSLYLQRFHRDTPARTIARFVDSLSRINHKTTSTLVQEHFCVPWKIKNLVQIFSIFSSSFISIISHFSLTIRQKCWNYESITSLGNFLSDSLLNSFMLVNFSSLFKFSLSIFRCHGCNSPYRCMYKHTYTFKILGLACVPVALNIQFAYIYIYYTRAVGRYVRRSHTVGRPEGWITLELKLKYVLQYLYLYVDTKGREHREKHVLVWRITPLKNHITITTDERFASKSFASRLFLLTPWNNKFFFHCFASRSRSRFAKLHSRVPRSPTEITLRMNILMNNFISEGGILYSLWSISRFECLEIENYLPLRFKRRNLVTFIVPRSESVYFFKLSFTNWRDKN